MLVEHAPQPHLAYSADQKTFKHLFIFDILHTFMAKHSATTLMCTIYYCVKLKKILTTN